MKVGLVFEYLFRNAHCESEFAHFCLFVLLCFLLYSFLLGVKEQLDAKAEEQRRKENNREFERIRQRQLEKLLNENNAINQNLTSSPNTDKLTNEATEQAKKDYSELQKDQMLKKVLLEALLKEEKDLNNYKFEKDKP